MLPSLSFRDRRLRPSWARALALAACLGLGLGLFGAVGTLSGCSRPPDAPGAIIARGVLRVGTLSGPRSWYLGAQGPEGFEFEMASAFARRLGVRLDMQALPDEAALARALREHRIDLAAAQLSANSLPANNLTLSAAYDHFPQVVVRRADRPGIKSLQDLTTLRVAVREGSPQQQLLQTYVTRPGLQNLQSYGVARSSGRDALGDVAENRAAAAIVDALDYQYARPVHPELVIALTLDATRAAHWLMPADAEPLRQAVDAFLNDDKISGALRRRQSRLARQLDDVASAHIRDFDADVAERLPALQAWFEQASVETGLDWRLIAALAYQESGWDPRAESANGAQGLLMLMPQTAAELGLGDPFDARQNVLAGARYFLKVRALVPARIPEPDRTWFAVAAYNMGYGHLEDGRVLTQLRGGNPDSWRDVRRNLPLLSDEAWYPRLKHGYARGWESQRTVDRVQQFLNLLEWRGAAAVSAPQPASRPNASSDSANAGGAVRR